MNSNSSTSNMTSGTASHIYFSSVPASGDVLSAMGFGTVASTVVVPKSGGTFTGAVTVPTPTASGHASTKGYVDSAASQATTAAQALGTGDSPTFINIETSTTGKVKQKGAFMQSSTHQAMVLGG